MKLKRLVAGLLASALVAGSAAAANVSILNVSYDPTRELYKGGRPLCCATPVPKMPPC